MTYPPTFPQQLRYVPSMSSTSPAPLRNVRHIEMAHDGRPAAHESRRFPGHDARMASHIRRIRTALCECKSNLPYEACCMTFDRQKSRPGIHYVLPPKTIEDMGRRRVVEDGFRISAFHTFHKAFRQEHDPTIRFIRALLASARPVNDHQQILTWHGQFRRPRRHQEVQP